MTFNVKYAKEALTFLILLALLLGVWSWWVAPQYGNFKVSRTAATQAQSQLGNLDREISEIENLTSVLEGISPADHQKIQKLLPYGQNLEDLLASLHRLGQQSGMLITSMYVHRVEGSEQFAEPWLLGEETGLDQNLATGDPVQKLQITMSARGGYPELMAFLELIERHVRLIDIETIGISSASSAAATSEILNISITAFTYYLDAIPEAPIFPFGRQLDLAIFDRQQFKLLQVLPVSLPVESIPITNPFAAR
jgi:Tfp pilus assembly protein PilO